VKISGIAGGGVGTVEEVGAEVGLAMEVVEEEEEEEEEAEEETPLALTMPPAASTLFASASNKRASPASV